MNGKLFMFQPLNPTTLLISLSWLGHLERMEEDRMPKKIFTQELEGMRRRGRPRKGWREDGDR
jgi:hypothetical protein